MGTDIHGGFIKLNKDGTKEPIKTNWGMERNYTLFAILAGVRNGRGCAGVYRHEPVKPIAEDRGLPEWLTVGANCVDEEGYYGEPGESHWDATVSPDLYGKWEKDKLGEWVGDHSHTHMTVDEILNWAGWGGKLEQGGVVDFDHYLDTIDKGLNPKDWCGNIHGYNVYVVNADEIVSSSRTPTHVRCAWTSDLTLGQMFEDFISEVKRIKDEHQTPDSEVYLVVGFDS